MPRPSSRAPLPASFLPLLATVVLSSACDLQMESPTVIEDPDLDDPQAIPALVVGVMGDFAEATAVAGGGGLYHAGALLTDELVHVGTRAGLRGYSDGLSRDDWIEARELWAEASQARWVAEEALTRISRILRESGQDPRFSLEVAEVALWAGHANRVMGDHFCGAVLDGGALRPRTDFYQRALEHFRTAVEIALPLGSGRVVYSALGGRAEVLLNLGRPAEAAEAARPIPTGFVHSQVHSETGGVANMFRAWSHDRGETSVWGTPFREWGHDLSRPEEGGDPRAPHAAAFNLRGELARGGDGRRPFVRQFKYRSYGSDIAVVKGTGARLVEAEAALLQGEGPEAAASRINEVRAHHRDTRNWELPPVSPTTLEEAWEQLMKERGLEHWLEGRRLPDLRRWASEPGVDQVPFRVVRQAESGGHPDFDPLLPVYVTEAWERLGDLCLEISRDEKESNPNL